MTTCPAALTVGEVRLTKIVERDAVARVADEMITGLDPAEVAGYLAASDPATVETATGSVLIGFHSWLLQGPDWTALIDPAVGNAKKRPSIAYLDGWSTGYLDELDRLGVSTDDVDFVISTHHHVDHVGWNTTWDGQGWVPTFPQARYIWSRLEFETFDVRHRAGETVNHGAHVDSVLPILDAGLADLVRQEAVEGFEVAPGLTLGAAAGHTAGTVVVRLSSEDEHAVFVGDCLHHPGQVGCTELGNHADADPVAAHQVRSRLLRECAQTGALLVPGHFTGTGCGYVRDAGGRLHFDPLPANSSGRPEDEENQR